MDQRILPVRIDFVPKTYDIDFAGVVSNIVYIRWLEDLRCLWLDQYFPLKAQMDQGYAPAVASTEIQYRVPIRMFSRVYGVMWVKNITRVKYVLCAEIISDGRISATAEQTGCFVGLNDLKPVKIPSGLSELFRKNSQPGLQQEISP